MYPAIHADSLIYAFEAVACLCGALLAIVSYLILAR